MAQSIRIKRGTRAQLDTAKTAGTLAAGEPYLITDQNRPAVGTATNAYAASLVEADIGATVCAQGDARLSNAREWTASTVTQSEAEAGTAATRRAWTAQRVFQAITAWWNASAAKSKLDGIATGATANATDAQLRDRSTHTGTQAVGTITGLGNSATLNVGTAAGTVCAGNDVRLSDARTPTAHTQTASTISDSTTAGRALLTAADAAAQRASLDLVKQTAISDTTSGRVALVDYIPRPPIDQIAGLAPTLDLDFEHQVYRHYSPATGLREKPLSDIVTFTRASSATYFDAKGVMRLAGSNVPRIDFDPVTGECKGLLIEESRVNSFLNSLLDGTNLSTQTVSVTAASWTISFYGTGSITISSGEYESTITGTSNTTRTAATFTPPAGPMVCTVSGTVKWAQCELGAFPTSFIPTAGATATRAADVAVISGTAFSDFYRVGVGSFLASFDCFNITGNPHVFRAAYGATLNGAGIRVGVEAIQAITRPDTISAILPGDYRASTAAMSFIPGEVSLACAGQIINASGVTTNPGFIYLELGGDQAVSGFDTKYVGYIKKLSYWPIKLSDATLQQLTAG